MQKIHASFICTLALLAFLMPAIIAEDSQFATANITLNVTQNTTGNITQPGTGFAASHTKVLRAGFEKTKPLNNLDVYGNKSTYNIASSTSSSPAFDISQRLGNVSQITYNTDIYKPIYNISQYSRTKPIYEVPDSLTSKPVYSISGYPKIKVANSIP
ncbi:MAG: hypothetical protein NTU95_02160 [Methanothrix sp.]|nr:hypothetical protein [Methanothrix sp.]